jgi:hypothetical protein
MAIAKKSSTAPAPAKRGVTSKTTAGKASAPVADEVTMEPITVQRTFLDGGERNEDATETLDHVTFPVGAKVSKVAVMVGTSEDYGAVKASVTVSVPCFLEELDDAAAFAVDKAKEILDTLAPEVAEEEEPAPKRSSKKGGKAVEPDEDDAADEGDGEEVQLYDEEELAAMDEDELKAICEEWEIAWPKSKKASVAMAQAIAAIQEKQAEFAPEEDGEEGEADGDDGDQEIGPEDIEAMDRKQLEAFIEEFNEENPDDAVEVDLADYPKNAKGLAKFKKELIEALFSE